MYLLLLEHQTFAASAIAQSVSGNFMFLHMRSARTPTLFLSLPIADSRSLSLLAEESWPVISPGIIKHPGTPNAMLVHTPHADLSHQPSDRLSATLNGNGSSVSYRHSLENEETKHDQKCPGYIFFDGLQQLTSSASIHKLADSRYLEDACPVDLASPQAWPRCRICRDTPMPLLNRAECVGDRC
ncbi:hypothetical protein BC939DRAFT_15434 [Gamsiella multidivaricata]|uniref:uncharacterized protein n=1 Tax=Gamsiella multidivaricata TaxID=101098 RepID=UPI00221F79F9|nr:uncharacterized protein BC939DRAFT_15434 [Gamsiella multidivaricata]KAI7817161.1 hypothetical protein BC939DRAFT_15434 [Gamsiella multidivaricata]